MLKFKKINLDWRVLQIIILNFYLILIITGLYFLYNGYKFAVSDEGGWIVYLNKLLDPSFYENDYLWSVTTSHPQEKFSLFSDIDLFVSRLFRLNFPLTHFVLLFITKFLLFTIVYFGSLKFFKNKSAAILALIFFIPGYFFAGPLIGANESSFIPRVLVQPFLFSAIIFAISGHWVLVSFLSGLSISIHAVSALPVILGVFLVAIINIKSQSKNKLLLTLFTFLIGISPLLLKLIFGSSPESILDFGPISENLKNIVIERKGYVFLSTWNATRWGDTLSVFALGLPFLLFFKDKIANLNQKILFFNLGIIFSNIFYFFVIDILALGIFLPLQFPRSISYIYLINLILATGAIIYFFEKKYYFSFFSGIFVIFSIYFGEKYFFYITTLIFITLPFLEKSWKKKILPQIIINPLIIFSIAVVFFITNTVYTILTQYSPEKIYGVKKTKLLWREFLVDRIHFTKPRGDISIQIQDWIATNTEKDAIILVDPDLTFFRIYSKRAVVFDHKDLGFIYHSEKAAGKILEREADVADFENIDESRLKELQKKYNVSYLVWKDGRGKLNFEKVYNQFGFSIYKLN